MGCDGDGQSVATASPDPGFETKIPFSFLAVKAFGGQDRRVLVTDLVPVAGKVPPDLLNNQKNHVTS
jgi:hypothetical protein